MKASWGHYEVKDGGDRKGREKIIVEVSTGPMTLGVKSDIVTAWAFLTVRQARKMAHQLLHFTDKVITPKV